MSTFQLSNFILLTDRIRAINFSTTRGSQPGRYHPEDPPVVFIESLLVSLLSGITPILLFSPYASQQSSPSETMAAIRRLHLEGQVSSSCALLLKRLRGKNDTSNKASKG